MSNWNSWENEPWEEQLASWKPRRPSPEVRAGLFGARAESGSDEALPAFLVGWRWLAPALVCSFMALVTLGPRNDRMGRLAGNTNDFFSEMARNEKYAAYLTVGFHSEQNGPLRDTLEWTFAPRSTSTVTSMPAVATNNLH